MKYKAALFDMDGTILDTIADMHSSVNASLKHFDLPEISLSDTMAFVGNGARRLIERSVPAGTNPELTEQVLSYYIPYYDEHSNIQTGPYKGIPELLDELKAKGIRLAVVSNKPDETVRGLSDAIFKGVFEFSIGEKEGIRRKPNPDSVLAVVNEFAIPASECVYIGDSEVDVATAANAGLDCISVTWGFRSRELLAASGAKCLVDSTEELKNLLLS